MGRPRTGKPRGRPPYPDLLTPAEGRVLAAVKAGRTNAEIAIQLGVSPETVKTHVSNILAKADATSREALLAWKPPRDRRRLPVLRGLLAPFTVFVRPRIVTLALAVATVVVAAGLVAMRALPVNERGGGTTVTPASTVERETTVEDLLARPLRLSPLAPGERCPITPTASSVPAFNAVYGPGPVHVVGPGVPGSTVFRRYEGETWASIKTAVMTDAGVPDPVILRGTRVDRPGAVRFGLNDPRAGEAFFRLVAPKESGESDGVLLFIGAPGCYGLQYDAPGLSVAIHFEVDRTPEGGWEGVSWNDRRDRLSPDGHTRALSRAVDGRIVLYALDVNSGSRVVLADDTDFNGRPEWSPDGKLLYEAQAGVHRQLRLALPTPVTLTPPDYTSWMGAWSPDGSQIAYCSDREDGWRIWVMRADGSDPRRITDGPGSDCAPRWSADGLRIGFKSNRDGPVEEWSVPAGGGTATKGRSD